MDAICADGSYGIRQDAKGLYEFFATRTGETVASTDREDVVQAILRLDEWAAVSRSAFWTYGPLDANRNDKHEVN